MIRRSPVFLLLAFTLAACQELPHPFADDRPAPHAPILTLSDTPGVAIAPVTGAPDAAAAALGEAMAGAFQDQEVPASTATSNKYSYHLSGDVTIAHAGPIVTQIDLHWTLAAADGKTLSSDEQQAAVPSVEWLKGDSAGFADLAKIEVAKLTPFVTDVMPVEHKPARQVFVRAVEGAPGNGRDALPRALVFLMKQHGVNVTPDPQATDTIAIAGEVTVKPVEPDQQHVQIVWHILKPDGTEAGQVAQENNIPRGSIDANWGDIAMAVAGAAIDDIMRVVNAIPPAS